MEDGWICLHRKSIDSRVFSDDFHWRLFCWCLLKANWKPGFFKGRTIPRGSFITGRESAAEQLGVSSSRFRRGVEKLKEYGCISVEATNRFTLIHIEKYEEYQSPTATADHQATIWRPSGDHLATTIEQRNKENKNLPGPASDFLSAWDQACQKIPERYQVLEIREPLAAWHETRLNAEKTKPIGLSAVDIVNVLMAADSRGLKPDELRFLIYEAASGKWTNLRFNSIKKYSAQQEQPKDDLPVWG